MEVFLQSSAFFMYFSSEAYGQVHYLVARAQGVGEKCDPPLQLSLPYSLVGS
jgi:hypothetical protein